MSEIISDYGNKEKKSHFDLAKEMLLACEVIRTHTDLELTNIEKEELKLKIIEYEEIMRPGIHQDSFDIVGTSAAVWFLKKNYGLDIMDRKAMADKQKSDMNYVNYMNYPGSKSFDGFKAEQEKQHKP